MTPVRKVKESILIICEGSNTEPLYFKAIEEELNQNLNIYPNGVVFKLSPIIISDDQQAVDDNDEFRTRKRKKRQLSAPKRLHEIDDDDFKPQPLNYLLEAKKELEVNSYNNVWIVFDQDGVNRDHLKKCFTIVESSTDVNINIAFSAKSFENWPLLHYEKSIHPFVKSICHQHDCGSRDATGKITVVGCSGDNCIIGYLRHKNYPAGVAPKGKDSIYHLLKDLEFIACINAAWQRHIMQTESPGLAVYDCNPYTNLDIMLKSLRKDPRQIVWKSLNEKIELKGVTCILSKRENELTFEIISWSKIALALKSIVITIENVDHQPVFQVPMRGILEPNLSQSYNCNLDNNSTYCRITFENQLVFVTL